MPTEKIPRNFAAGSSSERVPTTVWSENIYAHTVICIVLLRFENAFFYLYILFSELQLQATKTLFLLMLKQNVQGCQRSAGPLKVSLHSA